LALNIQISNNILFRKRGRFQAKEARQMALRAAIQPVPWGDGAQVVTGLAA
jgi:hypothetical protein